MQFLKKKYTVDAMTTCVEKYSKTCLGTIAYCLDSQTREIIQCASEFLKSNPTNCPDTVYFPTIEYDSF